MSVSLRRRDSLEQLNPTVKAATVLICVVLLSFQYLVALNLGVFFASLLSLLCFSHASWRRTFALLVPAFIGAFGIFLMGLYYAREGDVSGVELSNLSAIPYAVRAMLSRNLRTALQLATRLLAYAGLGLAFALSTKGEDFVLSLMHQCRLSPKFAYGVLAAFNLMPNMAREMRSVRTAFEVRNIRPGLLRTLFTMLVNSVRWSESVAMAMESKGFDGHEERTYYSIPRVRWFDGVFFLLCVGLVLCGMFFLEY